LQPFFFFGLPSDQILPKQKNVEFHPLFKHEFNTYHIMQFSILLEDNYPTKKHFFKNILEVFINLFKDL
jgi:hypothetical protein